MAIAAAAAAALAPGLGQAAPVAPYAAGDIIVADSLNSAVKAVNPDTGVATPVTSGGNLDFPGDVTFADDGDIFVVDRDAFAGDEGGIIRIDSLTATQTVVSNNAISGAAGGKQFFSDPIALDRKGSALYVTDFDRPRRVIKVNIATGKQSQVSKGGELNAPFGIVAAGLKKPLVSDAGAFSYKGGVMEINPRTGKQTEVSSGGDFINPQAIKLNGAHTALVPDPGSFDYKGALFEIDLRNGRQKLIAKGGELRTVGGVAVLDKDTAVVSNCCSPTQSGSLYRVNLKTGNQTPLNTSSFFNPLGIDIAP